MLRAVLIFLGLAALGVAGAWLADHPGLVSMQWGGRQIETSQISSHLKSMAKELKLPVLVLSQLSRAPEQRDKRGRPKLSDLRDSGATVILVEHDLDLARKAARAKALEARKVQASERRIDAMLAASQFDAAEQRASALLRRAPSAKLYMLRGRARLSRGDTRGALSDGGRALSLDPNLPGAMRVMGDAHLKEGMKNKALFYYRLFLARTPIKSRHARERAAVQKIVSGL